MYINPTTHMRIILLFSLAILLTAYFLQYSLDLKPCPLCLIQRFFLYGVIIFSSVGIVWPYKIRIALGGIISSASLGLFFAGRQLYLQSLPEALKPSCGPPLSFLWEKGAFAEVFSALFSGTGDCAHVDFTVMGLSLAGWSAVLFVIIIGMGVIGAKKT